MALYPVPAQANAGGIAVAAYPARPAGKRITVEQIAISSDSALASTALVVLNSLLVCGSANGNNDTADGPPAIPIASHDQLQVIWSGCTPGANCTAVFFYDETPAKAAS